MHSTVTLSVIHHAHKVLIWKDLPNEKAVKALGRLEKDPEDWDGFLEEAGPSTAATNAADEEDAIYAEGLFANSDVVLDLSGEAMRRDCISEACELFSNYIQQP